MTDNREARYAEAIEGAVAFLTRLADYAETDDLRGHALGHAEELRGVDAEQAELKAEVERLRGADVAGPVAEALGLSEQRGSGEVPGRSRFRRFVTDWTEVSGER